MGINVTDRLAAIPTIYQGRQYRSRLEARWAAFFDLAGWQFDYEPFDLAGWIPDFILKTPGDYVLVEVKPVTLLPEDIAAEIDAADKTHEALILGTGPWKDDYANVFLGWLREMVDMYSEDEPRQPSWARAAMGRWQGDESTAKNPKKLLGFCHEYMSFHDRITGSYDGGRWGIGDFHEGEVWSMWAEASNLTQWKSPG